MLLDPIIPSFLHERLYWRRLFSNFTGESILPLDFQRPPSWGEVYRCVDYLFTQQVVDQLNALTQGHPLSLLVLFSSAWAFVLHKYTGAYDIVIGTPAYLPENQISLDNVIPLRINLEKQMTSKDLLLQVRTSLLHGFQYQKIPYEELVTEVGFPKKRNRSSLFSTIISLEGIQRPPVKERYRSDLFIRIRCDHHAFDYKIEYNPDIFYAQSIENISSTFAQTIQGILQRINTPITELDCLSPSENQTFKSKIADLDQPLLFTPLCIHEAFENAVALYSQNVAVEYEDQALSYQALNHNANEIAYTLLEKYQVQKGTYIGFIGDRSIEYCAAVLGILKAGCAFLPIDISYPMKRIKTVLEDSQIRLVLVPKQLLQTIHSTSNLASLPISWMELEEHSTHRHNDLPNPRLMVPSDSPAYMIYTSGSTGHPKGVIIRHDGKMNHVLASHDSLFKRAPLNCLLSASISTDISIWQTLAPLLCGGKTVIVDQSTLFDFPKLLVYLEEKEVNLAQFVPSFIAPLLSHLDRYPTHARELPALRYLILSGEEVKPKLLNQWLHRFPHIPIVNAYGPSEASDIVAQACFTSPVSPTLNHLPIGAPLPNVHIFILDQEKRIQPFYAPGEIYIAGIAVGVGYWNDEAKTRAAFIDSPFSRHQWYKTGDIGRLLPSGSLEYLGRTDTQVKIRGFRVELTEIEACLLRHEEIKECKVVSRVIDKNPILSAYVVLYVPDQELIKLRKVKEALREHLQTYLPEYMLPNEIQCIKHIPTLPGGKIDIHALPAPFFQSADEEIIPPRNEIERTLCDIVANTVGISQDSVGMNSNFFDLGGTSIHLVAIKFRLKEQLKIDMTIERLFQFKTVEELGEYILSYE